MKRKIFIVYLVASMLMSLIVFGPPVLATPGDWLGAINFYEFTTGADIGYLLDAERINETEYYITVAQDGSNDGQMKIVRCLDNGSIQSPLIDTWEFADDDGISPGIIQIKGTGIYMIAFQNTSGSGKCEVATVLVKTDGTIQKTFLDKVVLANAGIYNNFTIMPDNCYVLVNQEYVSDDGFMYTFHVNTTDGTFMLNDSVEFDATEAWEMHIVPVDFNTTAIVYRDSLADTRVSTWNITTATGDIDALPSGNKNYNGEGVHPMIYRVAATNYYIIPSSATIGAGQYITNIGLLEIGTTGHLPEAWSAEVNGAEVWNQWSSPWIFPIQEGYLYGCTIGNTVEPSLTVMILNATGGTLTCSDLDGNEIVQPESVNYYPRTFHTGGSAYVCFSEGGLGVASDNSFAQSFGIVTNANAPTVTPYPPNNSAIPDLSTVLGVYVNDGDGDLMTINWWSNITGSWVLMQQNTSAPNGSYYCYNTSFQSLAYDHMYYWRIDCLDWNNLHNTTAYYTFTVTNFSAGYENTTEYVDLKPNITIYLNVSTASNVDNITWYFYNETTDAWEPVGNNETNFIPGNYSMFFPNMTECCHVYQWGVDLINSVTSISHFEYYWLVSMCLAPPSNFNAARWNSTDINLTWNRWSNVNASGTVYTMVRYSNDTYPTTTSEGILLYNGTDTSYNWTNLPEGSTYYFTAWTLYNKDDAWCESDTYTTDKLTLTGGTYNISIRYENNNSLMSPAIDTWGFINITFRYQNGTIIANESLSDFGSNPFSVSVNGTPDVVYITWSSWGIIRSLTPTPTTRNLTFWLSPRDYWNGSSLTYNISQLYYSFQIQDLTRNSVFASSPDTRLYIYRFYNSTVKMDIHQMYLSSQTAWAFLEYGQEYFFGIECARESRPILNQSFMALTNQGPITITIFPETDNAYFIRQFVNTSAIALSNKLWVNYTDSVYQTTQLEIKIYKYYSENGTYYLMKNYSYSNVSVVHQSWTNVQGYESNKTYFIEFNVTHNYITGNATLTIYSFPYITPLYDADWINTMLESVLGECPFGEWTRAFTFGIALLMLLGFASAHMGEVGVFVSGLTVFFMQVMVFDESNVFRFLAGGVGVLMCILGIVFYMGKGRQYQ